MYQTFNLGRWFRLPQGEQNTGQHNGMHQVSKTSDGKSSTLLACANIMDLSYSWCVRWTENPKDRARFPEGPLW